MYKLLLLLSISLFGFASEYKLQKGEIMAHTEVFGDNEINPKTREISSILMMNDSIETLRGRITIASISLVSEKKDRDENMYELLNITRHPKISFFIVNTKKSDANYTINGYLTLNGFTKSVSSKAQIIKDKDMLNISGTFSINLTQFHMEPPSMFFLTVRDQIDIKYDLSYTKGE